MKRLVSCLALVFFLCCQAYASVPQDIVNMDHKASVVIYSLFQKNPNDPWEALFGMRAETRGTGVVYKTDSTGTYILTAAHLKNASPNNKPIEMMYAVFEDKSIHVVTPVYAWTLSDEMVLKTIDGFQWPYKAQMEDSKLGMHVYSFTTKDLNSQNFSDGTVRTTYEEGNIGEVSPLSVYWEDDWGMLHSQFVFGQEMTMPTYPGMSGGGVFDASNGALLGPVNAGNDQGGILTPTFKSYLFEGLDMIKQLFPWLP